MVEMWLFRCRRMMGIEGLKGVVEEQEDDDDDEEEEEDEDEVEREKGGE